MPEKAPEPKRIERGPIKSTVRSQRADRKRPRGRPSKLDGTDFWLILDRIIGVLGQGGTDALAARCIQVADCTFREWRTAGEQALANMDDVARDELRHATTQYFTPTQNGGSRSPLVNYPVDRLAKLASVIEQAEANWVIVTLQNANRDQKRAGGGRIALGMITRRYGPAVYPPSHMPVETNPAALNTGGGDANGAMLRIKRVTIAVPANGFRPGEAGDDDEPVTDRKRKATKKPQRRKAG